MQRKDLPGVVAQSQPTIRLQALDLPFLEFRPQRFAGSRRHSHPFIPKSQPLFPGVQELL